MKTPSDRRYQSDLATAIGAESIAFPVRIFVRKPNYATALLSARAVLAQLEKEAAELQLGAVVTEIEKIGFDHEADLKTCSGVDLSCSLVLKMEAAAALWARTEVIVRVLDLVQKYVDQSRQAKEIQVQTGQARNRPESAGAHTEQDKAIAGTPGAGGRRGEGKEAAVLPKELERAKDAVTPQAGQYLPSVRKEA